MHTATIELVVIPFVVAVLLFIISFFIYKWKKKIISKVHGELAGSFGVTIFGSSLLLLGCVSLFIAIFFLITA